VRKVSIIPRGDAGGITFFQPLEENADVALYSRKYLISQIKVLLGGRGAEEVIYGQDNVTTGASSDFSQVYRIVREMVTTYGLGTHRYDYNNMSPSAARQIDLEIEGIVKDCYESVLSSLRDNRLKLERLKDKLMEDEIVEGEWVYDLMNVEMQPNKSIDLA
jgi:cell division protease FtsH